MRDNRFTELTRCPATEENLQLSYIWETWSKLSHDKWSITKYSKREGLNNFAWRTDIVLCTLYKKHYIKPFLYYKLSNNLWIYFVWTRAIQWFLLIIWSSPALWFKSNTIWDKVRFGSKAWIQRSVSGIEHQTNQLSKCHKLTLTLPYIFSYVMHAPSLYALTTSPCSNSHSWVVLTPCIEWK